MVCYIDRQEYKIKVFDIDTNKYIESLFRDIPTEAALGNKDTSNNTSNNNMIL